MADLTQLLKLLRRLKDLERTPQLQALVRTEIVKLEEELGVGQAPAPTAK